MNVIRLPPRPEGLSVMIVQIKHAVAEHYGLTIAQLDGQRKLRSIARPRQVAMWLARKLTRQSTTVIGRNIGGRDHSTVVFAEQRIDHLLTLDPRLWDDVQAILQKLKMREAA